uniref:Uncharacterized protein n=1 Tax=Romanomermis culicivorax TaxID=13658 RepID=A0A915I593_ROMCU
MRFPKALTQWHRQEGAWALEHPTEFGNKNKNWAWFSFVLEKTVLLDLFPDSAFKSYPDGLFLNEKNNGTKSICVIRILIIAIANSNFCSSDNILIY